MCRSVPFLLFVLFLACYLTVVVGYPSPSDLLPQRPQAGDIIEYQGQGSQPMLFLVVEVLDDSNVITHRLDSISKAAQTKQRRLYLSLLTETPGVPEIIYEQATTRKIRKSDNRVYPQAIDGTALSNFDQWVRKSREGFKINRTPEEGDEVLCHMGSKAHEPHKFLVLVADNRPYFVRIHERRIAKVRNVPLEGLVNKYKYATMPVGNDGNVDTGKVLCRVKGKLLVENFGDLKKKILPLILSSTNTRPKGMESSPGRVPAAGSTRQASSSRQHQSAPRVSPSPQSVSSWLDLVQLLQTVSDLLVQGMDALLKHTHEGVASKGDIIVLDENGLLVGKVDLVGSDAQGRSKYFVQHLSLIDFPGYKHIESTQLWGSNVLMEIPREEVKIVSLLPQRSPENVGLQ